jgi:hypothetical protein
MLRDKIKKNNQEKDKNITVKRIRSKNKQKTKCNKIKKDEIAKKNNNNEEKYKAHK